MYGEISRPLPLPLRKSGFVKHVHFLIIMYVQFYMTMSSKRGGAQRSKGVYNKTTFIPTLKNVGISVPKVRGTSAVHMLEDRMYVMGL